MKIGIMSDTHNHTENAIKARDKMLSRGVELIIHCGDLTSPDIMVLFDKVAIVYVFGNVDYDVDSLKKAAQKHKKIVSLAYTYVAHLDGVSVAACHGNDHKILNGFIESGNYDFVFHGHSHIRRNEVIDETQVINPGALGGKKPQSRSCCVLDLITKEVEYIEIAG